MPRVNLSIDDNLFAELDNAAKQNNITVNLLIINILEGLYFEHEPFDYGEALSKLVEETRNLSYGEEFILPELPSFSEICVAKAENAYIQPSTMRARLGKAFNATVRDNNIPWVSRAKELDESGNETLKFKSRAAVYVINAIPK